MSYMIVALILGILGLGTAFGITAMSHSFGKKTSAGKSLDIEHTSKLEKRIEMLENESKMQMEEIKALNDDMKFYKKLIENKVGDNPAVK